jgi:ribose transport system substrate-binding protein
VKHKLMLITIVILVTMIAGIPQAQRPTAKAQDDVLIVVIGKSPAPYWSNVELGVRAAAEELGLSNDQVVFFVPPREDVAAQIQAVEAYTAQGATGIALAASDPNALEPVMAQASEAGVLITTLDTPPVEDSVSLVYIGTDNYSAGYIAGQAMAQLLPDGGTIGIGRGSDTALNALQRTDGFTTALGETGVDYNILEPVNDREDAGTALQLANSVISANPDLAGAFGVYAYNGPAWATALGENDKVGDVSLVCFDATTDIINFIMDGTIAASVAQREYDMGYQSVMMIYNMSVNGVETAMTDAGVVDGVLDTGVDVITAANLVDYAASLDEKNIPYEWDLEGWEAPEGAFEFVMPEPAAEATPEAEATAAAE